LIYLLDVEDLFDLANTAFAVEIALAVARKDTSAIQIKNKQDLYQALTNREMFDRILDQGLDYVLSDKETFNDTPRFEQLQKGNRNKIVDYFMEIKGKVKLGELRLW
jgi:3'-phosphoadenosine 5'-phosphosulfate (PAPS) 3'-phosphatase